MPYIDPDHRPVIDAVVKKLPKNLTPGELNYAITRAVDKQLHFHGVSYAKLNELIGVLECVKQELYRRIAAKYEDRKCHENGDVYHAAP